MILVNPNAKKRRRNLGMSIIEMSVSGTIMLGVAALTFSTMFASTKLSARTVESDTLVSDARLAAARLDADIRKSETVLNSWSYSGLSATSTNNQIVLRQPLVDTNGQRSDPTGFRIVVYKVAVPKSSGINSLIRTEMVLDASWGIKSQKSEVLAQYVSSMYLGYYLKTALPASGTTVALPGALVSTTPTGSQLFMRDMVAPWAGVNLHKDSGFSLADILSNGLSVLGLQINLGTTAPAGATVDFNFQVDPQYKAKSDKSNWSNYITSTLIFKKSMPNGKPKMVEFDNASPMENKQ